MTSPAPYILPVLTDALGCLRAALEARDSPPALYSLRPGVLVAEDISATEDECCAGSAWVRLADLYPSIIFPEKDDAAQQCYGVASWAAVIQMGVFRCAPIGDLNTIATPEQWLASVTEIASDAEAMMVAACCLTQPLDNQSFAIDQWQPIEVQGGCCGGTMTVIVQMLCPPC